QANPGLTPPIIKAILQYTAEPLPGANLLQQGAGLVNVPGAITLSKALSSNINTRVANGSLRVGDSIMSGAMPAPVSVIEGRTVNWSRFVYLGGRHIVAGENLFRKFQPVYDPQLSWVAERVRYTQIERFSNGAASGFEEGILRNAPLVSSGVVVLSSILG